MSQNILIKNIIFFSFLQIQKNQGKSDRIMCLSITLLIDLEINSFKKV
jgi:hypothetical protein